MKAIIVSAGQGKRLLPFTKTLDHSLVDGESIGMLVFRGEGDCAEDLEVVRKSLNEKSRKRQTPVRDSRSGASD